MSYQETLSEKLAYRAIGFRKEFPELDWRATTMLTVGSVIHVFKSKQQIVGHPLSSEGSVLVVGNHRDNKDSREIWWASRRVGRVLRPVLKLSLMVQGAHESEEYLREIGTLGAPDEFSKRNAFILKGIGSLGILRDNPGRPFLRAVDAILGNNEMIGCFFQPTRNPDCILRRLEPGPAVIALRNRRTQVYTTAFGPKRTEIMKPFTVDELEAKLGRKISAAELTIMMADMVVKGLPEASQTDWYIRRANTDLSGREIELTRLTSPRRPSPVS